MRNQENKKLDHSLKLIVRSSFIVFIGIFISKILIYFYRIIIARQFGPEVYGLFSLSIMIVGWFIAIFSLGLVDGIVRYVSFYRGKKDMGRIRYLIKISFITLFFSTLIAAAILFYSSDYISLTFFHNVNLSIFLKCFSITIPLILLAGIFLSILQAFEKIQWYSFIRNILDNGTKLISLLILVYLGFSTGAVITSYILGFLILLFVSYWIARVKIPQVFAKGNLSKKSKLEIVSSLFSYSLPLVLSGLTLTLFGEIDTFAIGYFKDMVQVGIYNSALPISVLLGIVPALLIPLFFPLITKEFAKKNNDLITQMSKQVVKWIFILNLPFIILMVIFPGAIINLFFGADYLSAAMSLRFLSIGTFFYSIFIISENLLSMAGKTKIVFFNILTAAILNLILNIILVPKYGISGAAFSTMVSYILWGTLSFIQTRRHLAIVPFRRKIIQILLISLIPTFLLIFIKQFFPLNTLTLILQGVLFFLLYTFLVIALGGLDKNDYMIINTIKKKFYKRGNAEI